MYQYAHIAAYYAHRRHGRAELYAFLSFTQSWYSSAYLDFNLINGG